MAFCDSSAGTTPAYRGRKSTIVQLREVFGGKKQVSMFEMMKLVNAHLQ